MGWVDKGEAGFVRGNRVKEAKEILAIRADMPIILCTGFSHIVDEVSARAAGIKAFVVKPLTKKEIAKTVRKVLD